MQYAGEADGEPGDDPLVLVGCAVVALVLIVLLALAGSVAGF